MDELILMHEDANWDPIVLGKARVALCCALQPLLSRLLSPVDSPVFGVQRAQCVLCCAACAVRAVFSVFSIQTHCAPCFPMSSWHRATSWL